MRNDQRRMAWWGLVGSSLASGCVIEVRSDSDAVSFSEEITSVVVDLGEGNLHLIGADMVGAEVYRTLEWSGHRAPEVSAWVEDGVLFVESRCAPTTLICRVDHELVVPTGASVDLRTGSGDVVVRGIAAPVAAESGSGNVELVSIGGAVWVDTGSGDVILEEVSGDAEVSTGSGDIEGWTLAGRRLEASTGSGDVVMQAVGALMGLEVSTGSGDVELTVPSGSYALDIDTGSGDVELSGVSHSASAERWIDVDTGSGDVVISGRNSDAQ